MDEDSQLQSQQIQKTEVDVLSRYAERILQLSSQFKEKNSSSLAKQIAKLDTLIKGLLYHSGEDGQSQIGQPSKNVIKLSGHAQFLFVDCLSDLKKLLHTMATEHLQEHHTVSLCNKKLDQLFHHDFSHLLRNEKNIESSPQNLKHVNRLIFNHLLSLGRLEVANTFLKESEMSLEVPRAETYDMETVKEVMIPFKEKNYLPAINWLKLNFPDRDDLIFKLECQHIIRLLETDGKMAALDYSKQLQTHSNKHKDEISHVMFMVISYPNKGPYQYLFHEGQWFGLEGELSKLVTDFRSPLSTLLNVGAQTVPSLITMRALLNSSARNGGGGYTILPDELPCNVAMPEPVHSTFCCPILKVQSTETNPPVRLHCGHVISIDALNKLVQQTRNNRLKCPYCPVESNVQETIRVFF